MFGCGLLFFIRQPADAVGLTLGADAFLQALLGIRGVLVFKTAVEALKLFFHFLHPGRIA
jgi:hypothetical protein